MLASTLLVLAAAASSRADDYEVPLTSRLTESPQAMTAHYLQWRAEMDFRRRSAEYEARKTPEQIAAYQKNLREMFLEAIGGLPERTPLAPQITGVVKREGYRVEKTIFESQPKHFVTALLFLPEAPAFKPPYPGVLIPCGHAKNAKGHEEYQSMGALLALNGMAALVYDPIDQGERGQYLGKGGWPELWGTRAHSLYGVHFVLLGQNTARFEIWDGMRAIDYLQSRPEIDPKRIGCTGNSGGGTQTSYLMALDERIVAAAPSCYLCGFPALLRTIGPQDAEQNIFGQFAFHMDHADYITMRAPRPVLICTATKDFFDVGGAWETFRAAKRLYTRQGFAERVDLMENDAEHNYNQTQREGAARWMSRWLLGKDQPIVEPKLKLLSEEEYRCTPSGQVMLLPGARSVYDLNEDCEKRLAAQRAVIWNGDRAAALTKFRGVAITSWIEPPPKAKFTSVRTINTADRRIEQLLIEPETGIVLPAVKVAMQNVKKSDRIVLVVHQQGKAAAVAATESFLKAGATVLAVDLRGVGQTKAANEWNDAYTAYLLGRSIVADRAEDILACVRRVKDQQPGDKLTLVAYGHVGIPALHAAAVAPDLFDSVKIVGSLHSWSDLLRVRLTDVSMSDVIHGALAVYDLRDLAATLGGKLTLEEPADGGQKSRRR
jgi:dienelactone hydrolase